MEGIIKVIESIESSQANVNPTEIYNEGWMTRLLVHYSFELGIILTEEDFEYYDFPNEPNHFSDSINRIEFKKDYKWSSEGLISSPFIGEKAKPYREGYTHADMILGEFNVDYSSSGQIEVLKSSNLFGIIEAKMGSNLSKGTTNAKKYNQATRNLACIAHNTHKYRCPTFFGVVAPKSKFKKHKFKTQIDRTFMLNQIQERFDKYDSSNEIRKYEDSIIRKARETNVFLISYNKWINKFSEKPIIHKAIKDFYTQCKKWNNIE